MHLGVTFGFFCSMHEAWMVALPKRIEGGRYIQTDCIPNAQTASQWEFMSRARHLLTALTTYAMGFVCI